MSDLIRVALVTEGPTDLIMVEAAIKQLAPCREIQFQALQPEISESFLPKYGEIGAGWSGVYWWCKQTASEGNGRVRDSILFDYFDLLVIQLDADVASNSYSDGGIDESVNDLPCHHPCPPVQDTTDPLRRVLLRWMGEVDVPPNTVLCTPSMALETWLLVAFFPQHRWITNGSVECRTNPYSQINMAQPLGVRIKKTIQSYRDKADRFQEVWDQVRQHCSEAERFSSEMLTQLNGILP